MSSTSHEKSEIMFEPIVIDEVNASVPKSLLTESLMLEEVNPKRYDINLNLTSNDIHVKMLLFETNEFISIYIDTDTSVKELIKYTISTLQDDDN